MRPDAIDRKALNRATLARQLLLERSDRAVPEAVSHLVGLQAQLPPNPFVGLWSRLIGFETAELDRLYVERALVRMVVMRGTIHTVTAADALGLRRLFQPVLDGELDRHRDHVPHLRDRDLTEVLAFARDLLAERPLTNPALRAALALRFGDLDCAAAAYACRNHLALVQVPPRGLWGRSAQVTSTTAEAWLGRPLDPAPSVDRLMLRYLSAHGPATAGDAGAWSRLTGLGEVLERLRPQLRTFTDERGRELYDLVDAPRPPADTPAPPRFLPEYDNALLSHQDRSRFAGAAGGWAKLALDAGTHRGLVLHDGTVAATWRSEPAADHGRPVLHVTPGVMLAKGARTAVEAEARRLGRFLHGAATDVRWHPVP